MAPLERFVGPAGRPEQLLELWRKHAADRRLPVLPCHRDALGPVAEVRKIELERALGAQADERSNIAHVARLAVRCEPHHLELVSVLREPEILREGEVHEAERVRKEDAAGHRERSARHAAP